MSNRAPTAANILSSLGVKGAVSNVPTGESAESYAGYIPVLGADGKINIDFIPSSAVERIVKHISNVAVVDPNTLVAEENRSGSVVAPYKTIHEASVNVEFADSRCALLLMPGRYSGNDNLFAEFSNSPASPANVAIIGIGLCDIAGSLSVSGVAGGNVILQNIRISDSINLTGVGSVTCLGRTYVGSDLVVGEASLSISSETQYGSTDATGVQYLSAASKIGYSSSKPGDTVQNAIDRINGRKIRVARITANDQGFVYDEDSYDDLPAVTEDGNEIYDLRSHQKVFAEGINHLVEKSKNFEAISVTADKVTAKVLETDKLKMNSLMLGGYRLAIDSFGYLVVVDGDTPITPPSGIILISDSAVGNDTVYAITVVDGRMKLSVAGNDTVESPSSPEIVTDINVVDSSTGAEYTVYVEDGRMKLRPSGVESEDGPVIENQ